MSEPRNTAELLDEIAKLKLELLELKLAGKVSDPINSPGAPPCVSPYAEKGFMIDRITPMFKVVRLNWGQGSNTETLEQEHLSREDARDLCGSLNYKHADTNDVIYQVQRQGLLVVPQVDTPCVKPWTAPEAIPFKGCRVA